MVDAANPSGSPTGFLIPSSEGAYFQEIAPASSFNMWVTKAHQLEMATYGILAERCGIKTVADLQAVDPADIEARLPETGDRQTIVSFVTAAKAHMYRHGPNRVGLTARPEKLSHRQIGSSLDSTLVDPTQWYARTSQRLSIYEHLDLSESALEIMYRAVAHHGGAADHFDAKDLTSIEKELGEAARPALSEVWSWLAVGDLAPPTTDAPPLPTVDLDKRMAGDNLGGRANALVRSARRAALQAEVDRGEIDEIPPRVPGTISVRDVGLALTRDDGPNPVGHNRYLHRLLPAIVQWQTEAGPPSATTAEAFAQLVGQAVEYCLEAAGAGTNTAMLPPEVASEWLEFIDGPAPERGATTDELVDRPVALPDPRADKKSFLRGLHSRRAFALVRDRLAERVDTLRGEDGRLAGGIACYLSSPVHPMAGSWLRVGGPATDDESGTPPHSAQKWIRDAGIRFEPGLHQGAIEFRQPDGELVVKTGDDWVQLEFGAHLGEDLRPGLYRGAKDMPFREEESGFHLGAPKFGFGHGHAEFLVLKNEEDENGTVTAFTAMFRLSRYDVHGWVVYERPDEPQPANEAAA